MCIPFQNALFVLPGQSRLGTEKHFISGFLPLFEPLSAITYVIFFFSEIRVSIVSILNIRLHIFCFTGPCHFWNTHKYRLLLAQF